MGSIYNHPKEKRYYENNADSTAYSRNTEPKTRNGIIVNSVVSLRNEPNQNAKSLGLLAPGTEVKILEEVNDFYKVEMSLGRTGFILSIFCEEV